MFPQDQQIDDDSTFFQFVSDLDKAQISTTQQPFIWDFAAGTSTPDGKRKGQRRGKAGIDPENPADHEVDEDVRKKIVHRNVERQRRQGMATLHGSLRDLLPLEYIRGKRSASDHMGGAVSYIKDLQKRVGLLGEKRDELKKVSSSAGTYNSSMASSNTSSANFVQVRPCLGGIEVVVGSCVALSRALEVLLRQGLSVVSCISTRVDEGMIHSIQTDEVSNLAGLAISELERKLIHEFSSSSLL